ncbi:hypothetical protein ACFL4T_03515 [candidate division KSB1 bacterium]
MEQYSGTVYGSFETGFDKVTDEDIKNINGLENPPLLPVTKERIYIRRCWLAGDAVNVFYGKFRTKDLPRLLGLIRGKSVLVGHRKDTVGIARFFGGSVEKKMTGNVITGKTEETNFIVPKFYWIKGTQQAEDLRLNIDGGIYHQASLSWWYRKPTCSICGLDIRSIDCSHIPGKTYNENLCFYFYDDIVDVAEGSIVYLGAHPGTGFSLSGQNVAIPEKNSNYLLKNKELLLKKMLIQWAKNGKNRQARA